MQKNYYVSDRTVIKCIHCLNKLRVPTNKGKISVKCSVCRKGFIFNPNSILHTLRQILISAIPTTPKARRNLIIILVIALIISAVLLLLSSGRSNERDIQGEPGPAVYHEVYNPKTIV